MHYVGAIAQHPCQETSERERDVGCKWANTEAGWSFVRCDSAFSYLYYFCEDVFKLLVNRMSSFCSHLGARVFFRLSIRRRTNCVFCSARRLCLTFLNRRSRYTNHDNWRLSAFYFYIAKLWMRECLYGDLDLRHRRFRCPPLSYFGIPADVILCVLLRIEFALRLDLSDCG